MTVKELIKNNDNLVITKNGKILGIKCDGNFGRNTAYTSFLDEEVKQIDIIKGVIEDVAAIRL